MGQCVKALHGAGTMSHQADSRSGALAKPIDPSGQVVTAIVHQLIGSAESATALCGCHVAHDIVSARVDAKDGAPLKQKMFREGVEQRRSIEITSGAVNEADGVERERRGTSSGRRLEGTVE